MVHRLLASLVIVSQPIGLLAAQSARPGAANADVPVTKVVLYSSGVGYFEHAGTVRGNGTTELRFKTSQINDILKSIMLQDQDGGRVGAITYPSQDPLAKTGMMDMNTSVQSMASAQCFGAANLSTEWRLVEEHHRQAPAAGPRHGAR